MAIGLVSAASMLAAPASAAQALPAVTSIGPNNGAEAGGTAVTVEGSGFAPGSSVLFGTQPASRVTVSSPTSITAVSPSGHGLVSVTVKGPEGTSAATPYDQFGYDPLLEGPWLGLNGNNSTYLGPVRYFTRRNVVYDRSGPIDFTVGERVFQHGRLTPGGRALRTDLRNGMIPVVAIEYPGYTGDFRPDPRFPTDAHGSSTLRDYVRGFVTTGGEILRAFPRRGILLEPINEAWGYTTPQFNAGEYGAIIARLLPAARRAGIPLSDIYIDATLHANGPHGGPAGGWVPAMYAAQPSLRYLIGGWSFHPYGPPRGGEGIQSLPGVQATMTSGQNNIVVTEVGYCTPDVNHGKGCRESSGVPPEARNSREAARWLSETLYNALPYHQAGWLRALLVYSRNDGGWAMQLPGGALTAQGTALVAFAAQCGLDPTARGAGPAAPPDAVVATFARELPLVVRRHWVALLRDAWREAGATWRDTAG